MAIAFALLPLIKHINDLSFLGIYLGIFAAMVIIEIWAKLGKAEREITDHTIVEDVEAEEAEAREAEERDGGSAGEGSKRTD